MSFNNEQDQALSTHSDRSSQYCSKKYHKLLKQFGGIASMSRRHVDGVHYYGLSSVHGEPGFMDLLDQIATHAEISGDFPDGAELQRVENGQGKRPCVVGVSCDKR